MTIKPQRFLQVMMACLTFSGFGATLAAADESDPPTRVARLSVVEGSVSFQPGGTNEWVAPPINRPLTSGDQLWSDRDGRAELQLDGSSLRLSADTAVSLLNLSDTVTQIQLSSGSVLLRVRRLDENETYEIDTPNLAFSVLRPGLYRISVDGSGNSTAIVVHSGQAEISGGGSAYPVNENESAIFSGTDELLETPYRPNQDAFDAWSAARDARWDNSISARYVSPDVVGYEDLDDHGSWSADPEYGNVWIPRGVEPGWAPYHTGHWSYIAPWGYTWVDDNSWGFAPFHYGRWISRRGAWCWIPAPPRHRGAEYVRPVYSPALVAWVGVGAGVAWFALGPREVYVPSYPVSRRYVRDINVSNTNVNVIVVNNVYNKTIVNKTVVNNITYVNRTVPGAMVATTSRAFSSAEPVGRNVLRLDQGTVRSARVAAFAPPTVPTRQAVLGSGRTTALRPPAMVQQRTVVARTAPPAAPPSFERREAAIRSNGGRPLSSAQIRQMSAESPTPSVRLAPPARTIAPHAAGPTQRFAPPSAAPTAPAVTARPGTPVDATRANQVPAQRVPPSPANANSEVERPRAREQQQATQNAERTRVPQQQQQLQQQPVQNAERLRAQQEQQQTTQNAERVKAQQLQQQQQQQAAQNTERLRVQQEQQQQAAQNAERAKVQQQQQLQQQSAQNAERAKVQQQQQLQQQAAQNAERAKVQQQQQLQQQAAQNAERAKVQQQQQLQQATQNAERLRVQQEQQQAAQNTERLRVQQEQQQQAAQNAERARAQQQQQQLQQQQAAQNAERLRAQQQQEQQVRQQQVAAPPPNSRQPVNPPPKARQQDNPPPDRKDKTPPP